MNRTASIWLAVFPIALVLGVPTIPVVTDYGNHGLAAAAAQLTVRWYWGHLLSALGFGVAAVGAGALYGALVLRIAEIKDWRRWWLPLGRVVGGMPDGGGPQAQAPCYQVR